MRNKCTLQPHYGCSNLIHTTQFDCSVFLRFNDVANSKHMVQTKLAVGWSAEPPDGSILLTARKYIIWPHRTIESQSLFGEIWSPTQIDFALELRRITQTYILGHHTFPKINQINNPGKTPIKCEKYLPVRYET